MAFTNHAEFPSSWLQHEEDRNFTREEITLLANEGALPSGQVLGKITASGKYVKHNPDAVDGSQTVAGILLLDTTVGAADLLATAVTRGPAIVADGGLTHHVGITAGEKTAAEADLLALQIRVEQGG